MMSLLEVRDLQVRVEEREILHGLSLTVNKGEVHAIMGPNGSGDDMAQRRLAGAVRPHDRVDLARVYGQRQPVENLTLLDTDLQIFDFE